MVMKLSGYRNPRATDRIRAMAALLDSAIPFVNFHSRVAWMGPGSDGWFVPASQTGRVGTAMRRPASREGVACGHEGHGHDVP